MLFTRFSRNLGIDLGTANTLIYDQSGGLVLREPSVVAVSVKNAGKDRRIIAIGEEAKRMIGRTPGNILAIRPLSEGVIADFEITEIMLRYFIKKVVTRGFFPIHPNVVICVPYGVTDVERRAVEEAARGAGAREAYVLEEPLAAAIGANIDVHGARGSMIVDIGGGTTEVAVISLGGVVSAESLRVGGNSMDEAVISHVKRVYNLLIGERSAEEAKIQLGTAMPDEEERAMNIRGRDLISGLPSSVTITSDDLFEAMREPCDSIIDAIKNTLESTPPELMADINTNGITLSGGGALLRGFDRLISFHTGIPVRVADDPLDCVAKGAGMALEYIELFRTAAMREAETV
ncbi:MAG: rod shape-determining protein [Christensenellales bacterium]|jgi:rod shape-determining protein MreB